MTNDLSEIYLSNNGDVLLIDNKIPKSEIYEEAYSNGFIAIIEDSKMNPDLYVVTLLIPNQPTLSRQLRVIDVCRQLIAVASISDDMTAYTEDFDVTFNTLKATLYRVMKEEGIEVKLTIAKKNGMIGVVLSSCRSSDAIQQMMRDIKEREVTIPLSVVENKKSLVAMIHAVAYKMRIRVKTRTTVAGIKVSMTDHKNTGDNSTLRAQISSLKWDMPTPLTPPYGSSLLSTLAAQDPLQCFTVKKGIITKHSLIIKKFRGKNVLRVYGQVRHVFGEITDNDRAIMTKIVNEFGKTFEDIK